MTAPPSPPPAAVVATTTLPPASFRDRLAAAAGSASGRPTKVVDARTFTASTANGTSITVSIDNAYSEYLRDPSRLDEIIARYARVLTATDDARGEPIDQLVVIVRPSDYLRRTVGPSASLGAFVGPRSMAGDLSYFLAVDAAESIRTAGKADLVRWKVDEAEAWRRAIHNVKVRIGPLNIVRLGSEDGASGIGAASGLAPSLLVEPETCGPAAPEGMRGQTVLVYARDMFLFAMPADRAQTQRFWHVVKEEAGNGGSLSATPLTCRGGKWVVATAP